MVVVQAWLQTDQMNSGRRHLLGSDADGTQLAELLEGDVGVLAHLLHLICHLRRTIFCRPQKMDAVVVTALVSDTHTVYYLESSQRLPAATASNTVWYRQGVTCIRGGRGVLLQQVRGFSQEGGHLLCCGGLTLLRKRHQLLHALLLHPQPCIPTQQQLGFSAALCASHHASSFLDSQSSGGSQARMLVAAGAHPASRR